MTGFENAANVAEETINPPKTFPRALVGGMLTAGVIYVLVAMTAALTVPIDDAGRLRRGAARGRQGRHPPRAGRRHDDPVRLHRHGRDHQHHAGRGGHPVADPLRHGPRGRRPRRVRQGPPAAPQPVGRPGLQRLVVVAPAGRRRPAHPRQRRRRRGGPARDRDRGVPAVHLRAGDHLRAQAARAGRARGHASAPTRPLLYVGLLGNARAARLRRHRRPDLADLVRRPARPRRRAVPRRVLLRLAGPTRGPPARRRRRVKEGA